ncbi:chromosome segregation protein SMC [Erythrobacter sp. LQ02-29]|uniref:chromosome segregation protein SMC n=1 Tax=Erythrobacter sp. LQ02-29 TaxID=2920384 RepID=UPI001F4E3BF4|nr:chromosome segregation protein SMC [Erythrobacter sp. LQ02-29]MCP9222772.1 chromosome segregation protein SMC [Erythrobacter sp. LQ02-29]
MEIRRLKLSGFKSFVEPAELRIEPGLTGVVGPNGCGKSNLLEALRWVMGENSPKSMRSGGMEDVIFAGTEARPARDFAEVVLQGVDGEGEELDVTRRIERGAGSAYRVNGRDVRAKDVALTFADAATGAHSPALVSQGKIAQVIAAKPAERRMMLEEAAGIAGLHVRRRDAESKLRQTEANLARLEDLMAGLDSQIASLRRQAKQAKRYRTLSKEIAVAEARVLYARWRDAAAAAEEARAEAKRADASVAEAQARASEAQKAQRIAAETLAEARDELADRRDDASAHGHRMTALTDQLEAAEERLADLDRQKARLEEDRGEADRLTRDAAEALRKLESDLAAARTALEEDEARRPALARQVETAESAARAAELALARATADHAGVEADWRVAEATIEQARTRLERLDTEMRRQAETRRALGTQGDPDAAVAAAQRESERAAERAEMLRADVSRLREEKDALRERRDAAADQLSVAQAELTGLEREHTALDRDRQARERQAKGHAKLPAALDRVRAAPGYERALAAVLGRDAKALLGTPEGEAEGRYWTGRDGALPPAVSDSLAAQVTDCPRQLAARLALVHVVDADDGRPLAPGEWLVTTGGRLRRWDGLVADGEGAAEAARLEAANRLAELEQALPSHRAARDEAKAAQDDSAAQLAEAQAALVRTEREAQDAAETERQALRALDQAEAARERLAARLAELAEAEAATAEQREQAAAELADATERRDRLPDPAAGRAQLEAAQAKNEAGRSAIQAALAELAALDQALAVGRERVGALKSDQANWQARSGEAARRLAGMETRFEEIAGERAVIAAKPEGLIREIEQGDAVRARLAAALEEAQGNVAVAQERADAASGALDAANEALSSARESRAGLTARAENEEVRRTEMARLSGERFQCPPPLLGERFGFDTETVADRDAEAETHERLIASRERIGPVNLVAADELEKIEREHGASAEEQAELAEAVHRLRGSIGNLNREGRERLREAFERVDTHFRRLFTKLFEGGSAHLALVDSDDPLEAGLEIFAQPPGKKLQSLTLLSGGEQALTAIALIFGLFLTNPAPICVLDEVDAPLDDANIDRFCDLLDAMVRETSTRYLIVTHNAVTMSRMHRLFGVTMMERGVSRLVSVDLGEAERMAAE